MGIRIAGILLIAPLLHACAGTQIEEIQQGHQQRVAAVNERYDRQRARIQREWDELAAQDDPLREQLVAIVQGTNYSPRDRVDAQPEIAKLREACDQIRREAKDAKENGQRAAELEATIDGCLKTYAETYLAALAHGYPGANLDLVVKEWMEHQQSGDLEAMLAFSHNTDVLNGIRSRLDAIASSARRAFARVEQERAEALAREDAQAAQSVQAAQESSRRTWLAVAAGLQAGSAQYRAAAVQPSVQGARPASQECTSDFACGVGHRCIKKNFESAGFCAESVNSYGTPTYGLPALESVGPKMPSGTDCKADLDCPVLFRCEPQSGACLKR